MKTNTKIAVFASGNGSNFQAIADAIQNKELDAELVLVVTDRPQAFVVERAKKAEVTCFAFDSSDYDSKQVYEKILKEMLQNLEVEWIVLAGYMRLIGQELLVAFENRIVNIHPSVLPDFPGKDAIGQTIASGEEKAGVSVHFVDAGMDTGNIIAQQSFLVNGRDREAIEKEIHKIEHQLYPATLQRIFTQ